MKREILFRGKRLDNGKWLIGSLLLMDKKAFIYFDLTYEEFEVDPETVGQYTGLTDKNGVKIFEGDIVEADFGFSSWWFYSNPAPTGHDGYSTVKGYAVVDFSKLKYRLTPVKFEPSFWFKEYPTLEKEIKTREPLLVEHEAERYHIVGNIHGNQELLK